MPNAYVENNISIKIKDEFIILVRLVNYRKFHNHNFVVGQDKSYSKYVLLKGKSLDELEYYDIIYDWGNFEEHQSYWMGMDDIRFLDDGLLVTCSERNHGQPCQWYATLEKNIITLREKLQPSIIEKNWMPYDNKVIYNVNPLTIKSIFSDDRMIIAEHSKLEGYQGSTNGVTYNGGKLFLIHTNDKKTYHRWLWINKDDVKISEPFSFFKYSFHEFTCSLAFYQNVYYVSLGVNESSVYIIELTPEMIKI